MSNFRGFRKKIRRCRWTKFGGSRTLSIKSVKRSDMSFKRWKNVFEISSMMNVKLLKSLRSVTKRDGDGAIARRGARERRLRGLSMSAREPSRKQIMNASSCKMQRKSSKKIGKLTVSWANSPAS